MRSVLATLLGFALLIGTQVKADPSGALGPAVGESLPFELSLPDSEGAMRSMDSLAGEDGLVIAFNRSLDWCPYVQVRTDVRRR